MRLSHRRLVAVATLGLTAAILSACSSAGGSLDALCSDDLVISCDISTESIHVVVTAEAPIDQLRAFAGSLHDATSATAGTVRLQARAADPLVLDPEVTPPFAWQVDVHSAARAELDATLGEVLDAAAVPGAMGLSLDAGWPSVTVERLDEFVDAFDALSAGPLFASGGTYTLQSLDERLRIVHVPRRTSDEAIHEIVRIAQEHPDAEVLLEAMTSGAQYPTLYVSRLTPPEMSELDTRLRDARLATADIDGLPLEFVLGALSDAGTTYVSGTFGDVPSG